MKARCLNPNKPNYALWGGKGVTICPQWLNSFECFLRDMGPRPEGTSIDRIDSTGNYEPENCRWATAQQQAENTSRVVKVFYEGRTFTLATFADHVGVKRGTISTRRFRRGVKGNPILGDDLL